MLLPWIRFETGARAALIALVVSFAAVAANAGTLTLQYQLNGGEVLSGPFFSGTVSHGFITLSAPATSSMNLTTGNGPGGIQLLSFQLFTAPTGVGPVLSLVPQAAGVFASGNSFTAQAQFTSFASSFFQQGVLTALASVPGGFAGSITGSVFVSGLTGTGITGPPPSGGYFSLTQNFSISGFEISRVFVPEPVSGTMLGVGLAGLALAGGTRWMRRRR